MHSNWRLPSRWALQGLLFIYRFGTKSKNGFLPSNLFPVIRTTEWEGAEVGQVPLFLIKGWRTHPWVVEIISFPPVNSYNTVTSLTHIQSMHHGLFVPVTIVFFWCPLSFPQVPFLTMFFPTASNLSIIDEHSQGCYNCCQALTLALSHYWSLVLMMSGELDPCKLIPVALSLSQMGNLIQLSELKEQWARFGRDASAEMSTERVIYIFFLNCYHL